MDPTDITKYIDLGKRRKWWIITPFLLTLLAGLTYALIAPKLYKAETLILVQSPKVPQDYVRSIVSTSAEDRLRTITQQVTSRTNLEKIIHDYGLYSGLEYNDLMLDQKVELFRKNIEIQTTKGGRRDTETSSFSISFQGRNSRKVMEVTNTLASNFISENLKIRESQAIGTSSFLSDELKSAGRSLADKEAELRKYREKYMGGLPEQLDTNLRILERLQEQQDQAGNNLRDAENRRIAIQTQLAEQKSETMPLPVPAGTGSQEPEDLLSLKSRLASLQSKYTANHPDVIRLKSMIARLEAEESEGGTDVPAGQRPQSVLDETLNRQLQNTILEIKNLKGEVKDIQSQIAWYQNKVAETPKREQELLSLKRDYNNLQEVYNSLLNRKLEAEIAVSMEKKQKGEQFRVIDPAKIPDHPVLPDVRKIILLTLALGLGLGGGLAFLKETLDTSFKTPDDLKNELQLPVLVSLPVQQTERDLKSIKRKNRLAYFATGLLFILSAVAIVIATKGVDKTMEFVRNFVAGT